MIIRRLARLLKFREFLNSRSGGVLIYTAFAIPVVVGFAGLSVDVGVWYAKKRTVQVIADASAVAGALEFMRTGDEDDIDPAAELDAASNGYNAALGDTIDINHPPESGLAKDATDAVEVIVQTPAPTFFSKFFKGFYNSTAKIITARAVATVDVEDTCVYALNPTAKGAVKVAGGASVNLNCGVKINSDDSAALDQSAAGSCISTTLIKIHSPGWYDGDCVNASEGILTTVEVKDPMATVDPPVAYEDITCTTNSKIKANHGETITLDPGTYCNSIETVSTGTIIFNPGLYVLHGAALKGSAEGALEGDGVTFYLSPDTNGSDGINFQAGADIDLKAPEDASDGGMPGVLFYQSREVAANVTHHITAGADMIVEGTMYFPTSDINYSGGSSSLNASSAQLIADTVSFTGQTTVGSFENTAIAANPALVSATLVE